MSVSLPSNSASSSSNIRRSEAITPESFASGEDILSFHRISKETLPFLQKCHGNIMNRFAYVKNNGEFGERLSAINTGLEHVAVAIKKWEDWEVSVNNHVKELLQYALDYNDIVGRQEIKMEEEESEPAYFHKELVNRMNAAVSELKSCIQLPPLNEQEAAARENPPVSRRPERAADANGAQQGPTESSQNISQIDDEHADATENRTVPQQTVDANGAGPSESSQHISQTDAIENPTVPQQIEQGADANGAVPTGSHQHISQTDERADAAIENPTIPQQTEQAADANGAHQHGPTDISQTDLFKKVKQKYKGLDEDSQNRLLYLSVFPDDFLVRETDLRFWWMVEGNIPADEEQKAKDIMQKTLHKFEEEELIKPEIKDRNTIKAFKLDPLVRRILNFLAGRKKVFRIDSEGNFLADQNSKIALLLRTSKSSQYDLRNKDLKELETLFNVNESYIDIPSFWLSKAKKLSVLQLGCWQGSENNAEVANTDFFKSFVYLKCLKYLSFHRISGVHELPSSISKLQSLTILDLRACQDLTKVPKEIGVLKKLTRLDMSECYLIESLPKEIGLLENLEVLKGLVIWDAETEGACKISDLKNLKKLKKLSIFGTMGTDERDFRGLSDLIALVSLRITWISKRTIQKQCTMGKMENLKKLDLRCYPESKLPPWIDPSVMVGLQNLNIRGGKLAAIHKEWGAHVDVLRLRYLNELALEWEELRRLFPGIKYVNNFKSPKLKLDCNDSIGILDQEE